MNCQRHSDRAGYSDSPPLVVLGYTTDAYTCERAHAHRLFAFTAADEERERDRDNDDWYSSHMIITGGRLLCSSLLLLPYMTILVPALACACWRAMLPSHSDCIDRYAACEHMWLVLHCTCVMNSRACVCFSLFAIRSLSKRKTLLPIVWLTKCIDGCVQCLFSCEEWNQTRFRCFSWI